MIGRRRRKVVRQFRFLSYLAATVVAVIGMAALGLLAWRAWPVIVKEWNAANLPKASNKDRSAKQPTRPAPESPAESSSPSDVVSRLKKDNETLRDENARLREQLSRSEETLKQRTAELDEMKLRVLILDKTRAGQP